MFQSRRCGASFGCARPRPIFIQLFSFCFGHAVLSTAKDLVVIWGAGYGAIKAEPHDELWQERWVSRASQIRRRA